MPLPPSPEKQGVLSPHLTEREIILEKAAKDLESVRSAGRAFREKGPYYGISDGGAWPKIGLLGEYK